MSLIFSKLFLNFLFFSCVLIFQLAAITNHVVELIEVEL